ncbi:DoxX family protein [Nocardioides sp.]|uniref:DoxX family protein n=1 Tax=Nocardioides sp. TaxID=35761 RepID=UPI000C946915|nr:hypothetical protein [Pimelobacter sp.]
METLAIILSAAFAAFMLVSASGKLTKMEPVVANLSKVGVTSGMFPVLATIQVVGAIGLVVGIWVPAIGVAAAIGFVLYFAGACLYHVRADDTAGAAVPAGLAVFAAVVAIVRAIA